jgi:SAM-dependent methyltransferase
MSTSPIRFDDGAAYERFMGIWSRAVGEAFLDWLSPPSGWRWLDIGCGNGAFTEVIVDRATPGAVDGVDPSAAQLAYARTRPALQGLRFQQGDAMALPFAADSFDAAVMPLVIFFVPEPAQGVAEMARVVRPGGSVAAYAWDMPGGGFPYFALQSAIREAGLPVPTPPSPEASRLEVLEELWRGAGLVDVATREITVQRRFAGFDDYWTTVRGGPSVGATLQSLTPPQVEALKNDVRARLPAAAADGSLTLSARANAVQGRVPG